MANQVFRPSAEDFFNTLWEYQYGRTRICQRYFATTQTPVGAQA
ncbi:MAG TPA: hypothetical protein VKX16_11490 [Chloroflexota bacterium]|nr:hypothetical protein [Chloroflexota bacterium]